MSKPDDFYIRLIEHYRVARHMVMKHCYIPSDIVLAWVDEKEEAIEVLKEEWRGSETIHQTLYAQANLLDQLRNFVRECEIELEKEASEEN